MPKRCKWPRPQAAANAAESTKDLDWDDVDQVDLIGLEIGYGFIPLVNVESGGELMGRVKGVRKKLSAELGFLVQPVRIRDDFNIDPDSLQHRAQRRGAWQRRHQSGP
jgi:flagellar biosynthesis protein FlhA